MTAQAHQRLTLIVCTRDRLAQLRATLDCILRLRCREPWQLVVVDNGSSDGTLPWLQSLQSTPAVRVEVTSEPIQGVSRARNQGLTLAVGEIVAFTDDDCYPVGSFLDDLLVAFAPGDLDYCGGRLILHDPGDRPVSLRTSTTPAAYAPGSFVPAGAICGANMAFRRKTLEVIGPFDVALGAGAATCAGEDTDLVFRASWAGFRGAYLPHLLVRHHHGRRSAAAARATDTGYDVGRGAFYAKHLMRRATRLFMLRKWWWHLYLRSRAGRRRFLNELRGAWIYLRCARTMPVAGQSTASAANRARQPALP